MPLVKLIKIMGGVTRLLYYPSFVITSISAVTIESNQKSQFSTQL